MNLEWVIAAMYGGAAGGPRGTTNYGRYNTIKGMLEKGMAPEKRHELTEFGSSWDKVRALVGAKNWFKFTRSEAFKKALGRGELVATLGSGGYGIAELMKSEIAIGGKNVQFEFVRKTMKRESIAGMESVKRGLSRESFMAEAKAMRALGHGSVPSLYGMDWSKKQLFMEHIKGESAFDILRGGGRLRKGEVRQIEKLLAEANRRGLPHLDVMRRQGMAILPYNMLVTPKGKVAVIDWGLSGLSMYRRGIVSQEFGTGMTPSVYNRILIGGLKRQKGKGYFPMPWAGSRRAVINNIERNASGVKSVNINKLSAMRERKEIARQAAQAGNIAYDPTDLAAIQRGAQQEQFSNAIRGGRRHSRFPTVNNAIDPYAQTIIKR